MRHKTTVTSTVLAAVAVVLLILGIFGAVIASVNHTETVTCTVESKDRTTKPEGGSDMRIYTQECGVLSVEDSLLDGNFSAADRYASIKEGKRYEFFTRGWRVPYLGWFPNAITAKEVPA